MLPPLSKMIGKQFALTDRSGAQFRDNKLRLAITLTAVVFLSIKHAQLQA
jgi:hypothetical protein